MGADVVFRFFVNEKLLSGPRSILGKTFQANVMILGSMCGTIQLNDTVKHREESGAINGTVMGETIEKPIVYGAMFGRNFDGIVKVVRLETNVVEENVLNMSLSFRKRLKLGFKLWKMS